MKEIGAFFLQNSKKIGLIAISLFSLASCGGSGGSTSSSVGIPNDVPVAKLPVVGAINYESLTKPKVGRIIIGDRTQFTVIGSDLPPTAEMKIEGTANCERPVVIRAGIEFKQECSLTGTVGYRQVAVLTKANGDVIGTMTGGEVVVKFHTVEAFATDATPYVREVFTNPIEPVIGQAFDINVVGENLPQDTNLIFQFASICSALPNSTPSLRSFNCQFDSLGRRTLYIRSLQNSVFPLDEDYKIDVVPLGGRFARVPKTEGGSYDLTECVSDGMTGVVWEGKPLTGARAASLLFDNGSDLNARMSSYRDSVNASALCGFSDWRIPEDRELRLLAKGNNTKPNYDIDWLPNTLPGYYRSSVFTPPPRGSAPSAEWENLTVYFGSDESQSPAKYYLRLIRGPVVREVL